MARPEPVNPPWDPSHPNIHSETLLIEPDMVLANQHMGLGKLAHILQVLAQDAYYDQVETAAEILKRQMAWILSKRDSEIEALPTGGDEMVCRTWFRGARRGLAYREYRLETGRGVLVKAQSEWVLFDFANRKLIMPSSPDFKLIPEFGHRQLKDAIARWRPKGVKEPEDSLELPLRYADFDLNQHVNNARVLELLEELCHRQGIAPDRLKVNYKKEIPLGVDTLHLPIQTLSEQLMAFEVRSEETTHIIGEVSHGEGRIDEGEKEGGVDFYVAQG